MNSREETLQMAIADFKSGECKSQRAAAKAYGVPLSTFRDRLHGVPESSGRNQKQQRLSPEQENFLVDCILEEEAGVGPPSHGRVREMATQILKSHGDQNPLGKNWIPHFLRRNPRVAFIVGKKIKAVEAKEAESAQSKESQMHLNVAKEDI